MNPREVLRILNGLRILPYFPNDEYSMNALVRLAGSMCSSVEQVQWLVNRMTSGIYVQWPGPHEMRACFCCRYKPKDGVGAFSTVYPDGLPPDPTAPPRPGIDAPPALALPAGHVASRDRDLDSKTKLLAAAKSIERPMRRANPEPISPQRRAELQAQIDSAVAENRAKRAGEEADL